MRASRIAARASSTAAVNGTASAGSKVVKAFPEKSASTIRYIARLEAAHAESKRRLDELFPNRTHHSEVINRRRCNHILRFLRPTLEKYRGCTIIDLNPGAAVWTSALHEVLRPARHYLIDPDERFDSFLDPLVQKHGSKYVRIRRSVDPGRWETILREELLVNGKLLPPKPDSQDGSRHLHKSNPGILITGNLHRPGIRTAKKLDGSPREFEQNELARNLMDRITHSAMENTGIHRDGPVRSLFWMRERELSAFFPARASEITPRAARVNTNWNPTLVTGVMPLHAGYLGTKRRQSMHESVRVDQVANRMAMAKIELPKSRILHAAPHKHRRLEMKSPFIGLKTSIPNMESYLANCEAHIDFMCSLPVFSSEQPKPDASEIEQLKAAVEFRWLLEGQHGLDVGEGRRSDTRWRGLLNIDVYLRILRLEASVYEKRNKLPTSFIDAFREKLRALNAKLDESIARLPSPKAFTCYHIADEIHSVFTEPPNVSRDKRAYEAMQTDAADYWPCPPPPDPASRVVDTTPKSDLALVDFTPSERDMSVPGIATRHDAAPVLYAFCKHIFASPAASMTKALDRLAPNASKDLAAAVPELQDPRQGGRMFLKDMRARMVSTEMLERLVKAYLEWPFRPASLEFSRQTRW